ncbi:MAG: translocation/assembly module TamB [Myxococcaceae bacterium]|nr:translocation/assembly module TamB [Myxococcaceae bacterium]
MAFILASAAVGFLRTRFAAESACTLARRELPSLLGMDVGIGACALDPVTQTVRLTGVSLFEPGAQTPLVAADEAEVVVAAVHPLFGGVELDSVKLYRPRVHLDLRRPHAKTAGTGCDLDVLERVEVARLEIRNAEVRVDLPGERSVEVLGADLSWRMRRGRADLRLQAGRGRYVPGPGRELELTALVADGRFDPAALRLEVARAEVGLDGASLTASGDIKSLCEPELQLEANAFLPTSTLVHAFATDTPVDGHLWAHVELSGPAAQPSIEVDVSGSGLVLGRYRPGTFDARLSIDKERVVVESFESPVGAGTVRARGTIGLAPKIPLALDLSLDGAELGPALARAGLSGAWVNFPASGRAHLSGFLWPLQLEGDADLQTGAFVLASRAFDAPPGVGRTILEFERGAAKGAFQILTDRVELSGVTLSSPHSQVVGDATLWYAPEKGLWIRGQATALELDDFRQLAGIQWAGTGTGTFEVVGPYHDVRASAVVSLRDFDFWRFSLGVTQGRVEYARKVLSFPVVTGQKGRTQYQGSATLTFGPGPLWSKGSVTIDQGRLEDLVDVLMPMHENVALFDDVLEGNVAGRVDVNCPSDAFAANVDLRLGDTRYYGRRLGDGHMVLRFVDGDQAILEKTVLRGPFGRIEAEGTWDFDGPLDYRFRIDGALAELVGQERARRSGIAGDLTMVGTVGGDTTVYTVNAWLTSPAITFGGKSLGSARLEGRMVGRELQVWGRPFEGAQANLKMTVRAPYPWALTGKLSLPEIRPLLPEGAISQGVSGSIAGTVDAVGNLRDLKAMEGSATIDRFTLSRGDFAGANDGRIDLTFKGGRVTIQNFVFRGPNTRLTLAGSAGPSKLDLDVHGWFDVRLLESFVPQIERSSGRVELTAAADGTLEHPSIAGTASLTDGRMKVRDQPIALRGLSGRVEFSEQRVLIPELSGVLNEGRVLLDGDIRLADFSPKALQLRLQLDEVSARPVEYLPLTASGELNLSGRLDQMLTLSGDVDITKLRYNQELALDALLRNLRTARVVPTGGERPDEWLQLDVAVHASGDVRIDNNLARAKLRGDVRLTGTNAQPGLLGTLEAAEGSEIYFRGNTFAVSQALLEFKDRSEIDPVFDLHAQTQVREYLVSLHGFGRIRDPQIILSSDPDLPEADILSLLTIGVTSHDQSTNAVGTGATIVGDVLLNASGLDKQVQKFLPRNAVLRDLSFHIASSYNSTSGYVEPTAQLESKFLTDRLQLELSQPVVSSKGTKAQAEYRFDDRLAGQLQWDNERNESLPNFGVDLKLRWEVE